MSNAKIDDNEYIKVTIGGSKIWNSLFKKTIAPKSDTKKGIMTYIIKSLHLSWRKGMANMFGKIATFAIMSALLLFLYFVVKCLLIVGSRYTSSNNHANNCASCNGKDCSCTGQQCSIMKPGVKRVKSGNVYEPVDECTMGVGCHSPVTQTPNGPTVSNYYDVNPRAVEVCTLNDGCSSNPIGDRKSVAKITTSSKKKPGNHCCTPSTPCCTAKKPCCTSKRKCKRAKEARENEECDDYCKDYFKLTLDKNDPCNKVFCKRNDCSPFAKIYDAFWATFKVLWCSWLKWFLFPKPAPHSLLHECLFNSKGESCECCGGKSENQLQPAVKKAAAKKKKGKSKVCNASKRRKKEKSGAQRRMYAGDESMRPRLPPPAQSSSEQVWYEPPMFPNTEPVSVLPGARRRRKLEYIDRPTCF